MQQEEKNNYFTSQVFKVKISNTITVFMEICTALTKLTNGLEVLAVHLWTADLHPGNLLHATTTLQN
jgi:hypothetical protein